MKCSWAAFDCKAISNQQSAVSSQQSAVSSQLKLLPRRTQKVAKKFGKKDLEKEIWKKRFGNPEPLSLASLTSFAVQWVSCRFSFYLGAFRSAVISASRPQCRALLTILVAPGSSWIIF
jgi:hypothetical protein